MRVYHAREIRIPTFGTAGGGGSLGPVRARRGERAQEGADGRTRILLNKTVSRIDNQRPCGSSCGRRWNRGTCRERRRWEKKEGREVKVKQGKVASRVHGAFKY